MRCLFANAYLSQKNAFICSHNENSFLISAIRQLERDLAERADWQAGKTLFFSVPTDMDRWVYSELACLYLCNKAAQEIAPCMLYLPRLAYGSKNIPEMAIKQIATTKSELGW